MIEHPSTRELLVAIHGKCLDCSGGSRKEVHNCKIEDCPLWLYRIGVQKTKREKIKGQISVFEVRQEGA